MDFACGDSFGNVTVENNRVRRVYVGCDKGYPRKIYSIYKKNALKDIGIIHTDFCDNSFFYHPLLPITYPHEWCPSMFKSAILFHLDLLLELDEFGLTLKDAIPENILFYNNKPIFVDFFSLVTNDDLLKQEWLRVNHNDTPASLRYRILRIMFFPYMLLPLFLYSYGQLKEGRKILRKCFCNNEKNNNPLEYNIFSNKLKNFLRFCKHFIYNSPIISNDIIVYLFMRTVYTKQVEWIKKIRKIRNIISSLSIPDDIMFSGYTDYYASKNEQFPIFCTSDWKLKQHNFAKILDIHKPQMLLDVGCNTGWFSKLAASRGINVFAVDSDCACVEHIYRYVRMTDAPIVPLWLGFEDLTSEEYSLDARGNRQRYPLHMAATKRLKSQLVSCLGLVHHLTLGMGKSFEEIAKILRDVCKEFLLLEYVPFDDPLIVSEQNFFSSIADWNEEKYSLNALLMAFSPFFKLEQELMSTPDNRKLLLFRIVEH